MAKKTLTVPQSGTTPMASPLDNMLKAPAVLPENIEVETIELPKATTKKRTSINLDESIYTEFKVYCVKNGKSISGLLEQAMVDIMNGR